MSDGEPQELGIPGVVDAVLVGQGGFGSVYRATQPDFRRTVAVKVLTAPEHDDVARARFARECQAMGSLSDHPHIVTLYDAGFLGDARAYLVMAFMEGGSLHEAAARPGGIGWAEMSAIGIKLAGALETAHRAGILHRDLKPANVLMSAYGEPQLTDFGIARIAGGHETTSNHVTASLPYAPPEVIDGVPPSRASDVYGLAATLVHLVTNAAPFTRSDDTGFAPLLRRVYEEAPPELGAHGVPEPIAAVLHQAMAKRPEDRPPTAEAFGRALQHAREQCGVVPGELIIAGEARASLVYDAPSTPTARTPTDGSTPPPPTPPPVAPPAPPAAPAAAPPPTPPAAPHTVLGGPLHPPTPDHTAAGGHPPYPPLGPASTGPAPGSSSGGDSRRMIAAGAVAGLLALVAGFFGVRALTGDGDGGRQGIVDLPTTPTAAAEAAPTATADPVADVPTPAIATVTPQQQPPTPVPSSSNPVIEIGEFVEGSLASGQIASYSFTGEAARILQILVTSPDGDPQLTLRSADGTRIGYDDDCGVLASERDARLITSLPSDGTYVVEVEFIGTGGTYSLSLEGDVSPGQGSVPFATMVLQPRPGTFQEVWTIADGDFTLVAQDANGRLIANDDDCFKDLDPRIEGFAADPSGIVFVDAYQAIPEVVQIGVFNIDGLQAEVSIPSGTQTGFVLDLTAGDTIDVAMTSIDGDAVLSVFDLDGNSVAADDDSGGGTDAALSYTVEADGRYTVGAGFLDPVAGIYQLSISVS